MFFLPFNVSCAEMRGLFQKDAYQQAGGLPRKADWQDSDTRLNDHIRDPQTERLDQERGGERERERADAESSCGRQADLYDFHGSR